MVDSKSILTNKMSRSLIYKKLMRILTVNLNRAQTRIIFLKA